MTTLARLHDKGALTRAPAGRSYAYTLAASPDTFDAALTARQMTRLLNAGTNRTEALARFVAALRPRTSSCSQTSSSATAWYFQYKNVKADYAAALWNIVNWADVAARFTAAKPV